mgnify:FL=1
MKQYKAVAGPKNVNVGKGDTQSAFNLFADIINREAAGGWATIPWRRLPLRKSPAACNRLSL